MTTYYCDICGSKDIRQEATIMVNPNDNTQTIFDNIGDEFEWRDYYYCEVCKDTCFPVEKNDEIRKSN